VRVVELTHEEVGAEFVSTSVAGVKRRSSSPSTTSASDSRSGISTNVSAGTKNSQP